MNSNRLLSLIIKIAIIISTVYGIIMTYHGPITFSYFTTLSNIFVAIMILIFLINEVYSLLTNKKIILDEKLYIVKFLATISISLTFFVFLTLLAPTIDGGIINAYFGNGAGSLCVHFITPVLSIIDFLFFDNEYNLKNIHAVYAIIPPLTYVLFVVIASNLGLRWGNMYAPYNFLNFRAPTGWFGFDLSLFGWETLGIGVFYMLVLLSLLFIVIGRIFIWLKKIINKSN